MANTSFFSGKLLFTFFSLKDVNEVTTSATGTGGAAGGITFNNINQVVHGIYTVKIWNIILNSVT